jgi:uncharacterized membrane protein
MNQKLKFAIVGLALLFVLGVVNGFVNTTFNISPTSVVGFIIDGLILLFGLFYGLRWARAEPE